MKQSRDTGMALMLADIRAEVAYTRSMIGRDKLSDRVMAAMSGVPRDEFVPDELKTAAFDNGPLPIGCGQTISQPYIVALMSDLVVPRSGQTVLEIGTGSGYQTAVLSLLCQTVYSVEVVPALADAAARRLAGMGYTNVYLRQGNGYEGWPEHAPFDGIIVTAAAPYVPDALIEQLKPGGRLVIPVGLPHMRQELMVLTKGAKGDMRTDSILGVAFVPLVGAPEGREEGY
jgi:protein-L-isoaspartate(D-aspartate) O-methyltransferase